jgi:hypothetical protein
MPPCCGSDRHCHVVDFSIEVAMLNRWVSMGEGRLMSATALPV